MTDDEREVRNQVEEDRDEDLELDEDRAAEIQAGTSVPGNTKWTDITLKKGQT